MRNPVFRASSQRCAAGDRGRYRSTMDCQPPAGSSSSDATDAPLQLAATQEDCTLPAHQCVTEAWLRHQRRLSFWLEPDHSPLYRPTRDPEGVPAMRELVICLAGFRGEERRNAVDMIRAAGATWSGSLVWHIDRADHSPRLRARRRDRRAAQAAQGAGIDAARPGHRTRQAALAAALPARLAAARRGASTKSTRQPNLNKENPAA